MIKIPGTILKQRPRNLELAIFSGSRLYISTSSAIHRGIRSSQRQTSKLDSPFDRRAPRSRPYGDTERKSSAYGAIERKSLQYRGTESQNRPFQSSERSDRTFRGRASSDSPSSTQKYSKPYERRDSPSRSRSSNDSPSQTQRYSTPDRGFQKSSRPDRSSWKPFSERQRSDHSYQHDRSSRTPDWPSRIQSQSLPYRNTLRSRQPSPELQENSPSRYTPKRSSPDEESRHEERSGGRENRGTPRNDDESAYEKPSRYVPRERRYQPSNLRASQDGEDSWRGGESKVKAPIIINYTTPASEFLYGTSAVRAAIDGGKRKLYRLYLFTGHNRQRKIEDAQLIQLVESLGVPVEKTTRVEVLDKMSDNRPHNGHVLEASPLPRRPVAELLPLQGPDTSFQIIVPKQSSEDEAINGKNDRIEYKPRYPRYPFVVLVDGILEPGNLGAVVRSAYFLGVDAIILSNHCAPLSNVALKAASGAMEQMPLLTTANVRQFLVSSQTNGWKIYAADAMPEKGYSSKAGSHEQQLINLRNVGSPLMDHPCMLLLGSEGSGLRDVLKKKADALITIRGQRSGQGEVDSLNVSVAAGILFESFLRFPRTFEKTQATRSRSSEDSTEVMSSKSKEDISEAGTGALQENLLF